MRWAFKEPLQFEGGKRYAFMIGFVEPGKGQGFTLANANVAGVDAVPDLIVGHDLYKGGWSIRREGDGTIPPSQFPGKSVPSAGETYGQLIKESLFATGDERFLLEPTTDGYPDVDTYRDLEFYMEVVDKMEAESPN